MSDAIVRFERMLEMNPKNELARFSLAKALYDSGHYAEAKNHFERALSHKPDWMVAQILLGKCELSLGNRDSAREAFEKGRQLAEDQNHDGPREEMEEMLAELGGG